MAVEIEVKSNSRQAQADLARLNKSVDNISRTTDRVTKQFDNLVKVSIATFAVIGSTRAITNITDSYRRLEARIALATDGIEKQAVAFKRLNQIAIRTRSNQESLADLYSRIGRATKEMGVEQETVIQVTENIAKAITISGSSAVSANAAIVQLGQGLAAGALRGQELNSVMEQTPAVAQAIARGLGITIGELRAFANEGKLSAEAVITALKDQGDAIDQEFKKVAPTLEQSLTVLGTGIGRVVNEFDKITGFSGFITQAFLDIGASLNSFAPSLESLIEGLTEGNFYTDLLGRIFQNTGRVVVSIGNLIAAVFDRLIPTSLLIRIERLRAELFVAFIRGAGGFFRAFSNVEMALLKASLAIDELTAKTKRSIFSRFARSFAQDSSRLLGDFTILTASLSEGLQILETRAVTFLANGALPVISGLKQFRNALLRIRVEIKEIPEALQDVTDGFAAFSGMILESFKRLRNSGFLIGSVIQQIKNSSEIKDVVNDIRSSLVGVAGDLKDFPDVVQTAFSQAFDRMKSFARQSKDILQSSFREAFENITNNPAQGVVNPGILLAPLIQAITGLDINERQVIQKFDEIKEAFVDMTSGMQKGASFIKQTFIDIYNYTVNGVRKVIDTIKNFRYGAEKEFYDLYIELVGNSIWPDTIDGIVQYTKKLFDASDLVARFSNLVQGSFRVLKNSSKDISDFFGAILNFATLNLAVAGLLRINPLMAGLVSIVSIGLAVFDAFGLSIDKIENGSNRLSAAIRQNLQDFKLLETIPNITAGIAGGLIEIGAFDALENLGRLAISAIKPIAAVIEGIFGDAIAGGIAIALSAIRFGIVGPIAIIAGLLSDSIVGSINAALSIVGTDMLSVFSTLANNAGELLSKALQAVALNAIPILLTVGEAFVEGFTKSIPIVGDALFKLFSIIDNLTFGVGSIVGGYILFATIFGKLGPKGILALVTSTYALLDKITLAFALKQVNVGKGAGVFSNIFFGKDGKGGFLAGISSALGGAEGPIAKYALFVRSALSTAFSGSVLTATFLGPIRTLFTATVPTLFAKVKSQVVGIFATGGLFDASLFGGKGGFASVLAKFNVGLKTAETAAGASSARAQRRAGRGGLLGKVLIGAALFGASTGAFASDISDGIESATIDAPWYSGLLKYADVGLLGLTLFGPQLLSGFSSMLATAATAIASFVMANPLTAAIAIGTAAVVVGGSILANYLFGANGEFFTLRDQAGSQLNDMFNGVQAMAESRRGLLSEMFGDLNDFNPQALRGSRAFGSSSQSGENDLFGNSVNELIKNSAVTASQLTELRRVARETKKLQTDLNKTNSRFGKTSVQSKDLLKQISSLEKQAVGLLKQNVEQQRQQAQDNIGAASERETDRGLFSFIGDLTSSIGGVIGNLSVQEGADFEADLSDNAIGLFRELNDLAKLNGGTQDEFNSVLNELVAERKSLQLGITGLFSTSQNNDLAINEKELAAAIGQEIARLQGIEGANLRLDALDSVNRSTGNSFGVQNILKLDDANLASLDGLTQQLTGVTNRLETRGLDTDERAKLELDKAEIISSLNIILGSTDLSFDTFSKNLSKAGADAFDRQLFDSIKAPDLSTLRNELVSIEALSSEVTALSGTDPQREAYLNALIEERVLNINEIAQGYRDKLIPFQALLNNAGVTSLQQDRLSLDNQKRIADSQRIIEGLQARRNTVDRDNLGLQQDITREIEEQEDVIERIQNTVLTLGDTLAQSGLNSLQVGNLDDSSLETVRQAVMDRLEASYELQNNEDLTLESAKAYYATLLAAEATLRRTARETRTLADSLGEIPNITALSNEQILQQQNLNNEIFDINENIRNGVYETNEEYTEAVKRLREVEGQQGRLNSAIERGKDFAKGLRADFESTVSGILKGTNDVGDLFDTILGRIATTSIDNVASQLADLLFSKDNSGLEDFFGSMFGNAETEGENMFSKLASFASNALTPVIDGLFGDGALSGIGDFFGGLFGSSDDKPDGTENNPLSVRIAKAVQGVSDAGLPGLPDFLGSAEDQEFLDTEATDFGDPLGATGDSEGGEQGKATIGLTMFTDKLKEGVAGLGGWVSQTATNILQFLGLATATTTQTTSSATAAVTATSLSLAMNVATGAAAALASAMLAAAATAAIPGFSTGGAISGPGTGTSDSILARLSNGEYVINAASTRKYRPIIEAINNGDFTLPAYADGGVVASDVLNGTSVVSKAVASNNAKRSGGSQQNISINVTGDISRQTKKEIFGMLPTIATGVNQYNSEQGR